MTRRDAIHNLTLFLAGSPLLAQQAGDTQQERPSLEEMINVFDFEPLLKANATKAAYDYVRGGGWDEWTLRRNREAFGKVTLWPRYLREVAELDLSTTLFGKKLIHADLRRTDWYSWSCPPRWRTADRQGSGSS